MAKPHTFRFLDLPKEIRLMVYERLPRKVSHHAFTGPFESSNWSSIHLVYVTLPGVVILATCRQIRNEAETILRPHLLAIQKQPVRLIRPTRDPSHASIINFLDCLTSSRLGFDGAQDVRNLINVQPSEQIPLNTDLFVNNVVLRVEIALRDTFADSEAKLRHTYYQTQLLIMFQKHFERRARYWSHAGRSAFHVRIRFQATSLLADDQVASGNIAGQSLDVFSNGESMVDTLVHNNEGIERVEWESDWAEGERYF
jgi:hypothetical protein